MSTSSHVPADSAAFLHCFGGACKGRRFGLEAANTVIGRESNCGICLEQDGFVSRHHAVILRRGNRFAIRSDGGNRKRQTTNGTFLNGINVDYVGMVPMLPGDTLRVGDSFFRFQAGSGGDSTAAGAPPTAANPPRPTLIHYAHRQKAKPQTLWVRFRWRVRIKLWAFRRRWHSRWRF